MGPKCCNKNTSWVLIPAQSLRFTYGRTKAQIEGETQPRSHSKLLPGLRLKPHPTNCFPQWVPIANLNYPNSCPMAEPAKQRPKEFLYFSIPLPPSSRHHVIPFPWTWLLWLTQLSGGELMSLEFQPRIIDSWRQTLDQSCLKYGVLGK